LPGKRSFARVSPHITRRVRRPGALWLLALLASIAAASPGCTGVRQWRQNGFKVGPNYRLPPAPVSGGWIDSADGRVVSASAASDTWWDAFADPTLNSLIESAQRQNLDVRAAGARILEARAKRSIAAGNLFPQSPGAFGVYAHGQIGQNFPLQFPHIINLWLTGFNLSWEADFWGRYRRTIAAADAEWAASVEGYRDALVMLLGEVATSYVQVRTFQQRIEYARRNVDAQRGSLEIAEVRFRDGHVPELDVQQARSNLAQTRSQIRPLESSLRMANNQLCVLLAMPAQQVADSLEPRPIPEAPAEVAVGIPAELLRRRPDVRQAEREVAAQSEQIGIATADLYPRFALNGFLGYAPTEFGDLFSEKSFFAFVFPTFQWKILNYGRLRNNIQMQQARFQGRVLKYQQTVLQAQREVEDALAAFLRAQEQARDLEESVTATERSVELVLTMYRGGIADFNRVYNTQSLLAAQQDQLAQVRGTIALRLIDVYRALGGGWQYFSHSAACAPLATTSASLPAGHGRLPNSTRLKPAGPSPARSTASSADGAEAIAPLESLPPGSRSDRLPTVTE